MIPVLNAEAYLAEALTSVRQQTGHAVEIIVVDDGSTDGSFAIAERMADQVLRTSGRTGPSQARNLGVQAASADWIAFLDADDCWLPDHLDNASHALEGAPNAGLCFSRVQAFGTDSYTTDAGSDIPSWIAFDACMALVVRNIVPQISVVVRKRLFVAAGGYDNQRRLAEDFDLWHRLAVITPFVYVPVVTALYRVHPSQATKQQGELLRSAWEVRCKYWPALYQADRAAGLTASVRLSEEWIKEVRWTIRAGNRTWYQILMDAHECLRVMLGAQNLPAPAIVRWSPSTALWYRVRRVVKDLLRITPSAVQPRSSSRESDVVPSPGASHESERA